MWTHKAWPAPPNDRLRWYARRCNAVEGNATFYATPTRDTVTSWALQTPAEFRFVVKLPKLITHQHRLTNVDVEVPTFLDAIDPLGPRAHALWIQLPASFTPSEVPALARFLRRLPRSHRYAVEVRHPDFFRDPGATRLLEGLLESAGVEWIPFDTTTFFDSFPTSDAEREAWARKPRLPVRTRALTDQPIVRYLGRDAPEPTIEGWRRWVDVVVEWLREGRSPTVFVHTPDNVDAPVLARRFYNDVRARVPGLEPLPVPAQPMTLF